MGPGLICIKQEDLPPLKKLSSPSRYKRSMVHTSNKHPFGKIRNSLSTWNYEIATQEGGRDFQSILGIYMGALNVYFAAEIPANWNDMKQNKLLVVSLQTSDAEYTMVSRAFHQTCPNFVIEKVSRLLIRSFLMVATTEIVILYEFTHIVGLQKWPRGSVKILYCSRRGLHIPSLVSSSKSGSLTVQHQHSEMMLFLEPSGHIFLF